MATIESLKEYQSSTIDEVLCTIRFKASGGGAPEVESDPLDILKTAVRVHFFRYGLFPKNPRQGKAPLIIYAPEEQAEHNCDLSYKEPYIFEQINLDAAVINAELHPPQGAVALENYSYQRTTIKEGYIYIFDEDNRDWHTEYEVSHFGNLTNITWDDPQNKNSDGTYKDTRTPVNRDLKRSTTYHVVPRKGTKIRVCFSPVQWSAGYHNKVRTSEQLRSEKMLLVDCTGIPKNSKNTLVDVQSCKDVLAHFEYDQNTEAMWLQLKLKEITDDEKQQKDDLYEDMFVTLHDPLACADTICEGIDTEITYLKALVQSCQTAIQPDVAFKKLLHNEEITIPDNEKNKQIRFLHLLALGTYKFIFDNPEMMTRHRGYKAESKTDQVLKYTPAGFIDRMVGKSLNKEHGYGQAGASRKKLEKLLAVKEREAQRNIINSYRDDLGNFMSSDYYQDVYDDYIEAVADFVENGKWIAAHHTEILSMYPNQFDRVLDLEKVYKLKDDKWIQEIGQTLDPNPAVFTKSTAVLDKKLCWSNFVNLSLAKKTTSTMGKIQKAYIQHGDHISGKMEFKVNSKICYIFRDHQTRDAVIKFEKANLKEFLANNKKEIDFSIDGNTRAHLKEHKVRMHKRYGDISRKSVKQLIAEDKVSINLKNSPKKHALAVQEFYKSTSFATIVLTFEILSLTHAIKKYQENDSTLNKSLLAGSGIKLAAATATLLENTGLEEQLGKNVSKKAFKLYRIGFKVLKITGSSVTVFSAVKDTYAMGIHRDYDAMAAYGAAAAIGTIFVVSDASILFGTGSMALGFFPAAILGGVLISVYAIAKFLEDTEIEAYFKNYPLSNYAIEPKQGELPHQYIQRLYVQRNNTIDTSDFEGISENKFIKYRNFETAYIGFMDMIAPHTVDVGAVYPDRGGIYHELTGYTNRFKAQIQFFEYFDNFNDLDIKIWFYPRGIGKRQLRDEDRIQITMMEFDFIKKNDFTIENSPSRCFVAFGLPQEYYYTDKQLHRAEILFLCRLKGQDGNYTPLEQNNTPRYYFGNARVFNAITTDSRLLRSPFGIAKYHTTNGLSVRKRGTNIEDAERVISIKDVPLLVSYPDPKKG